MIGVDSENGAYLLETTRAVRVRPLKDWFPSASTLAKNLIQNLLQFNPHKRLTCPQALAHPYLSQFLQDKPALPPKPIQPPISDNTKLTVRDYQRLVYDWIVEHYEEGR